MVEARKLPDGERRPLLRISAPALEGAALDAEIRRQFELLDDADALFAIDAAAQVLSFRGLDRATVTGPRAG